MRAIFIATSATLLENFHWMIYIFGAFLIITGVKMLLQGDHKLDPQKNPWFGLFQRWIPMTNEYHGQQFSVRQEGKLRATLLMLVLVVVETTDVIFAVDSIPAILQSPGPVYRLYLQCLRDSWTAGALFYARRRHGNVRLPESRPVFRSLLCRSQDVGC